MQRLHLDFETASLLDLTKVGAYKYASHPSTFIRCMAWAVDGDDPQIWVPSQLMPDKLKDAIQHCEVHAWNAQFERLMFEHCWPVDLPSPTFNQYRCTAAHARANALPGSLAKAAKVLKLDEQKGDTRLMKKLASATYNPSLDELLRLYDYCMQDVVVEREIFYLLPSMPDDELFMFQLNERINDRGIGVDMDFVHRMADVVLPVEVGRLNEQLDKLTNGYVTAFTQTAKLCGYLKIKSVTKQEVERHLDHPNFGEHNKQVLRIRQLGAKSSTAKYQVMQRSVMDDNRLRGMFVYAGAGQTGRFSSTGVQLHNLPRAVPKDAAARIASLVRPLRAHRLIYGSDLIEQASQLIRPSLIAGEGKMFVIGDFSAVEAKGVPWLAGVKHEVEAWASGVDRYIEDAAAAFRIPESEVDDRLRQAGKVVRLASQFGGKAGALQAMAKGYGLALSETEARDLSFRWHEANPWVVHFGRVLEKAAISAVLHPGVVFNAGEHINYASEFIGGVQILRCLLPSGRVISYHDVLLEASQFFGGDSITAIKPSTCTRTRLWYGSYIENVTQAMCNDLMRFAMVNLSLNGYEIVAHVHDETVEEVDEEGIENTVADITDIMEQRPTWAVDFPLAVKVHASKRYGK